MSRLHGRPVLPGDRAGAGGLRQGGRRRLVAGFRVLGEVHVVQPGPEPALPFAVESGEAVLDVGGVLHPALLAVVDHVQAGLGLMRHRVTHGLVDLSLEVRRVGGPLRLVVAQHFLQRDRAGKAARVGGQRSMGASFHDFTSVLRFVLPIRTLVALRTGGC